MEAVRHSPTLAFSPALIAVARAATAAGLFSLSIRRHATSSMEQMLVTGTCRFTSSITLW